LNCARSTPPLRSAAIRASSHCHQRGAAARIFPTPAIAGSGGGRTPVHENCLRVLHCTASLPSPHRQLQQQAASCTREGAPWGHTQRRRHRAAAPPRAVTPAPSPDEIVPYQTQGIPSNMYRTDGYGRLQPEGDANGDADDAAPTPSPGFGLIRQYAGPALLLLLLLQRVGSTGGMGMLWTANAAGFVAASTQAIDAAGVAVWSMLSTSPPACCAHGACITVTTLSGVVSNSCALQSIILAWLTFTAAPLMRTSRTATLMLSRCLAVGGLVPSWFTAALAISGSFVGRALRCMSGWALANHLVRQMPAETSIAIPKLLRVLASQVDGNGDNILQAFEIHNWVLTYSRQFVAALVCWFWAQWFMAAKAPPPWTKCMANSEEEEEAGGKGDPVDRHFAALRRDPGVSWERQARSTLIDSALTLGCYAVTIVSVLNALNLDVTGLLAIGGVGGVAISFGAQRVMGNLVSGLLLFITQPFKAGDRIKAVEGGPNYYEGVVQYIGWHSTVVLDVGLWAGSRPFDTLGFVFSSRILSYNVSPMIKP